MNYESVNGLKSKFSRTAELSRLAWIFFVFLAELLKTNRDWFIRRKEADSMHQLRHNVMHKWDREERILSDLDHRPCQRSLFEIRAERGYLTFIHSQRCTKYSITQIYDRKCSIKRLHPVWLSSLPSTWIQRTRHGQFLEEQHGARTLHIFHATARKKPYHLAGISYSWTPCRGSLVRVFLIEICTFVNLKRISVL